MSDSEREYRQLIERLRLPTIEVGTMRVNVPSLLDDMRDAAIAMEALLSELKKRGWPDD